MARPGARRPALRRRTPSRGALELASPRRIGFAARFDAGSAAGSRRCCVGAPARRGRRGRGRAAARQHRLWRGQGRPSCRRSSTQLKDARDAAANAAGFRIASLALSGQRQRQPRGNPRRRRRHRPHLAAVPRRRRRARAARRPIPGSPKPPCSSSIPAACRSPSTSARRSRCGSRTARSRSSPTTAPCSSRIVEPRFATLPLVVGAGAEARAQGFSRRARPLSRDPRSGARLHAGRRAALEPAAEERHRRAAAGRRRRPRARRAGARSTATRSCSPATSRRSTCACRTGVTVRLSDAAAQARAGGVQGQKTKKKAGDA